MIVLESAPLETPLLRLEPLRLAHLNELRSVGSDDELWANVVVANPFKADDTARVWFTSAMAEDRLAYVMLDRPSNRIIGTTQLYDIDLQHTTLEIGKTFVARKYWGTHVNATSKYLLLRYAFETMNMRRVQLRAGAPNERSRRAIEQLGARYEATMRSFFVHAVTGEPRDVVYYSIIAVEWPEVKTRLEARLRDVRTA
jgi:RimJ/RimL family protein N-acetyltransferase